MKFVYAFSSLNHWIRELLLIPTTVISQLRCTGAQCLCTYSFSSQNAQSPEAPTPLQMTMKRLPLSRCLLVLGLCHTSRTSAKNNSVILQMTSRKWSHTPHFPTHIVSMGTLGKKILLREFTGTHFRPGGPGLHCTVLEVWFRRRDCFLGLPEYICGL